VPVSVVVEAGPVSVAATPAALCPTIVICGVVGRPHVREPVTDPRITTNRIPDDTDVLGKLPLEEVTMIVSALEAHRPSW
jgi:hypothetical protein